MATGGRGSHGANVTAQNNLGSTPRLLHLASPQGRVDIARMLSEHGANLTAQNNDGVTVLLSNHLTSWNLESQLLKSFPGGFLSE
jgi:ankyrin repeat protein